MLANSTHRYYVITLTAWYTALSLPEKQTTKMCSKSLVVCYAECTPHPYKGRILHDITITKIKKKKSEVQATTFRTCNSTFMCLFLMEFNCWSWFKEDCNFPKLHQVELNLCRVTHLQRSKLKEFKCDDRTRTLHRIGRAALWSAAECSEESKFELHSVMGFCRLLWMPMSVTPVARKYGIRASMGPAFIYIHFNFGTLHIVAHICYYVCVLNVFMSWTRFLVSRFQRWPEGSGAGKLAPLKSCFGTLEMALCVQWMMMRLYEHQPVIFHLDKHRPRPKQVCDKASHFLCHNLLFSFQQNWRLL